MNPSFFEPIWAWFRRYGFFVGCLAVILGSGIYVRWTELAWHFTNTDDLGIPMVLLHYAKTKEVLTVVASHYTNAPFQFIFTNLLLNPSQTYREVLFWSRFPSCIAGTLGLFGIVFFYYLRDRFKSPAVLLAAVLMAFSWENIAYAKQSYDYAIGVMAVTGILVLFMSVVRLERVGWGPMLGSGALLAVFGTMQYSVLLFVPAFYLAVALSRFRTPDFRSLLFKCIVSATLFGVLFWPVWHSFLSVKISKGIHTYSAGFQNEYLFLLPPGASWIEKIKYAGGFFGSNLGLVIATRFGFTPENGWIYQVLTVIFLLLFGIGVTAFLKDRRPASIATGRFVLFALLVWFLLIIVGRLPFGPTRHTLIFLPVFAVIAAHGFELLFGPEIPAGRRSGSWRLRAGYGLVLILAGIFMCHYRIFLDERRDPFREEEIAGILEEYRPGEVFYDFRSVGLRFMKTVQPYLKRNKDRKDPFDVIARISRYPIHFDLAVCEETRARYNAGLIRAGYKEQITHPCSDYERVFVKDVTSDVQVNFSRKIKTEIFTNSMYIDIVRLKKEFLQPGNDSLKKDHP